jgi:NDP-sugar pyrophosphorylase family protein
MTPTPTNLKALILAAGFGKRLLPLTDLIPKPLIPFMGKPLIDISIEKIRPMISQIAVNCHYKSEILEAHIKALFPNCYLSYESTILGTGGAIYPLKQWIGDSDLLIYNSDIICDIDLSDLIESHYSSKKNPLATMLLLKSPDIRKTAIGVGSDGDILSFGSVQKGDKTRSFTGIHIISNRMIQTIPDGFHSIIDSYKRAICEGYFISSLLFDGFWRDLGTPSDFWQCHKDFLATKAGKGFLKDQNLRFANNPGMAIVQSTNSTIHKDCNICGDVFLFGNSRIRKGAKVTNSIIINGDIPQNSVLENIIVYKHQTIHHS